MYTIEIELCPTGHWVVTASGKGRPYTVICETQTDADHVAAYMAERLQRAGYEATITVECTSVIRLAIEQQKLTH